MGRKRTFLVILDDGWAWRTRLLRRFAEEKLQDPICNQNMKSAVQWAVAKFENYLCIRNSESRRGGRFVMGGQRTGVTPRGQGDIYMLHPRKLTFVHSLPPQSRAPYFHATFIGSHFVPFAPHTPAFVDVSYDSTLMQICQTTLRPREHDRDKWCCKCAFMAHHPWFL